MRFWRPPPARPEAASLPRAPPDFGQGLPGGVEHFQKSTKWIGCQAFNIVLKYINVYFKRNVEISKRPQNFLKRACGVQNFGSFNIVGGNKGGPEKVGTINKWGRLLVTPE